MPEEHEERPLFEYFLEWLYEQQIARDDDNPVTVYDMLTIVKSLIPQLRMTLTSSEVAMALVHANAYMERWMRENDYTMREVGSDKVVRIQTAEEVRFGQNPLAEAQEGWVPDEMPEWLTEE